MSLSERFGQSVRWAFLESALSAVVTFGAVVLTSRLIMPADFGLAAIAIMIGALVQAAMLTGVQSALVRTPSAHTALTDSLFLIFLVLGTAAALVCIVIAAPIARIYGEPELVGLIAVQGLSCAIVAVAAVPTALLTRKLRTRALAASSLFGKVATLLFTVGGALLGSGAWAIVLGAIAGQGVTACAIWAWQSRRPRGRASLGEARPVLRLGGLIGIETLVSTLSARVVLLLFGHLHGIEALGFLSFAVRLVDELASILIGVANRTSLAIFSKVRRDGGDTAELFDIGTRAVTTVSSPIFFGVAAVGPVFIDVAFGPRWSPAALATQVIAVVWAVRFSRALSPAVMRAHGSQSPLVMNAFMALGASALCMYITSAAGPNAALIAFVVPLIITLPSGVRYLSNVAGVDVRTQITSAAVPLIGALAMLGLVTVVNSYLAGLMSPAPLLVTLVIVGVSFYLCFTVLLNREGLRRVMWLVNSGRA